MLPLYEMLARSQDGHGLEAIARQFNLSQQQAQAAVEALLPAFSQGLKRSAADPYGLAAFMGTMASGQHAQFFEDAGKAFGPQGVQQGNDVLGQIFGSKDLSRAVAAQAAQATGLGQEMLKQMLPVIASMIMGGLFKQSTNQFQAGAAGASNPLGQILEQIMRQGMPGAQPAPQAQPADPFDNPFGKMMKDMFGGGQAAPQPAPQAQPADPFDNPFGKMMKDMFGAQPAPAPQPQPRQPEPEPNPSGRPRTPYDDLFGEMFETGAKQRDEYQRGVESIFDQFTRGMDRHR